MAPSTKPLIRLLNRNSIELDELGKKIVEGYNFGRNLSNEEKKAIICAVLKPKKLNKSMSIYISKLSGNLSSLGLGKQEVYGSIINMAIVGSAVKKGGYDYSSLLRSSKKVQEFGDKKVLLEKKKNKRLEKTYQIKSYLVK